MEVKAKAIKNIFSEATEEQVNAISKLMEKQAEEHSAEIAKLQEQLTAANNQIKEFQSMNIDEIKASAAAWQEKYAASEKAWNEKLAGLKYEDEKGRIIVIFLDAEADPHRFKEVFRNAPICEDLTRQALPHFCPIMLKIVLIVVQIVGLVLAFRKSRGNETIE